MRPSWFYITTLFFLISCIDPFSVQTGNRKGALVVDGLIADQTGLSVIRLSRSLPFDNTGVISSFFDPERNATVSVHDSNGNVVSFYEAEPGVYKTDPDYAGSIGTEYFLRIHTSDGEQYESTAETMLSVPEIEDILYTYHVYEELIQNANGDFVPRLRFGFKISAQVSDPPSERNHYRWKASGIFEFFGVTPNTLYQCWVPIPRLENGLKVKDDAAINGQQFIEELFTIPYDRPTYYQVTLKQFSLTANAHRFWNDIRKQQTNTGSIFDPIPSQIKGNVFNIGNPKEFVMGYFGASAVTEKVILISRWHASGSQTPSPNLEPQEGDCLFHIFNATDIKPPGFP